MNKAFIKEPEAADPICPRPHGCGGPGVVVPEQTLAAQLSERAREQLAEPAYYCANPSCEVAYFDGLEGRVAMRELQKAAYPKDPKAPVCSCLDVSALVIRETAAQGDRTKVKEVLAHAESADADCLTRSPAGRSCVLEVRRLFMKYFQRLDADV